MEPSCPLMRSVLGIAVLAAAALLGGCRRADDVRGRASAPHAMSAGQAEAGQEQSQSTGARERRQSEADWRPPESPASEEAESPFLSAADSENPDSPIEAKPGGAEPPEADATGTAPADAEPTATASWVQLNVDGPRWAAVGDQLTFELVVVNWADAGVTGLLLKARFDPGLEPINDSGPIERYLKDLLPGQAERLTLMFRVARPGTWGQTVEVFAGRQLLASKSFSVTTIALEEPDASRAEAKRDLGPPLVDDPEGLQALEPEDPRVWVDRGRRYVVLLGEVCQRRAPLELFTCLRGSKEHESVVVVDTLAYILHAALEVTGAVPGGPVQFVPDFVPPRGTEIEVEVVWEDGRGRRRRLRGQDWVRDVSEMYTMFEGVVANGYDEELNVVDQFAAYKSMAFPWVFAGSQIVEDGSAGRPRYLADGEGDLICVSNFPSAVLDVPVQSTDSNAALLFEAFTERIPPLGTPVTLILTPKLASPDR